MTSEAAQLLGLTERELTIYQAGLKSGPSTARALAKQTQTSRPLTYHALTGLQNKGFSSSSGEPYRAIFFMTPPKQLKDRMQQRKKSLDQIINVLDLLPKPKKQNTKTKKTISIRHYSGVEGIRMAAVESLRTKSNSLASIVSMKHLVDTIDLPFLRSWVQSMKKQGIKSKSLWTSQQTNPDYDTGLRRLRILPSDMHFPAGVTIEKDRVLFYTADKSPAAIIIESKAIAEMMQSIHNQLWSVSSDPRRQK